MTIKKGDVLYDPGKRADSRYQDRERYIKVTKIGRDFIYAVDVQHDHIKYKIRKDGENLGVVRDFGAGWRVYLSKEDFTQKEARREMVGKLNNLYVGYGKPSFDNVSDEDFKQALKLLGIE